MFPHRKEEKICLIFKRNKILLHKYCLNIKGRIKKYFYHKNCPFYLQKMFKSSLLFVTFLFTILLLSNKFSEISAKPKPSDIGICTGKCNNIDRGDICCLVSIYPLEKETT